MNDSSSLQDVIIKESKEQLIKTANQVILGKIDMIEGARMIDKLAAKADIREDDLFLPIISFVSQTDHFPSLNAAFLNSDYTKKIDSEKEEYIQDFKKEITSACNNIIKKYSV